MTTEKRLGILLFVSALFLFAVLDTTSKYLTAFFSVPLLVWARYTVHLLLMLVFIVPGTGREIVVTDKPGLLILRGFTLLLASIFLQLALRSLPIAETSAIFFTSPLIVALLAGPLLGEKVGIRHWLATLGGFAGVLLIARPGGAIGGTGLIYAVCAAMSFASYQILTRKLSATEPVMRQLFYTALVGSIAMLPVVPFFWTGTIPTLTQAFLIVSLGLTAGTGHFLLTRAFRETPASTLSPMLYLQLVWVALLGWIVFDQYPDALSAIGILFIVLSGLSLVLYANRPDNS